MAEAAALLPWPANARLAAVLAPEPAAAASGMLSAGWVPAGVPVTPLLPVELTLPTPPEAAKAKLPLHSLSSFMLWTYVMQWNALQATTWHGKQTVTCLVSSKPGCLPTKMLLLLLWAW